MTIAVQSVRPTVQVLSVMTADPPRSQKTMICFFSLYYSLYEYKSR